MSMNHLEAIPVDTHIFQIATRDYLPHLKIRKSLTSKVYNEIADHFRSIFGRNAGWAHLVSLLNHGFLYCIVSAISNIKFPQCQIGHKYCKLFTKY